MTTEVVQISYKIGIVGAGAAAGLHAKALQGVKGASLESIYNRSPAHGNEFAEEWGIDYIQDYQKFLSGKNLDYIVVCTPTGTHLEFALPAAQAGKNLVIEKPLETTVNRCDKIIDAAEDNEIDLAVIFQNRFKKPAQKIKQAVKNDKLGKLVLGSAKINWYRSDDYYKDSWKGTKKYDGGGALINQGIHTIDLLQWIMADVVAISGKVKTLTHDIQGEDVGVANLEFENGALGVITGSTSAYPGLKEELGIYGSRGSLELKGSEIVTWEIRDEGSSVEELEKGGKSGASDPMDIDTQNHRRQWEEILKARKLGEKPPVKGKEARKSVEIINSIYESSKTGNRINLA